MSNGLLTDYGKSIGDFLYSTWRGRTAQIVLALCCFALPVFFAPLALHESRTNLWVRAGLPKSIVKRVLIPGGTLPLQYALVADKGVYRSTDNGVAWLAVNNGLPLDRWGNIGVQVLAVNGSNPSVIYAGMGGVSSRDDAFSAGLYLTDDGGATWLGLGKDMAGKEVQAITVMPTAVANVVCIATDGEIYRSIDGGQSWLRLDWRGVETRILSLALHPSNPNVIYVGTEKYGLYGTENGGISWIGMNRGLSDLDICDIAIAVNESHLMYLATNGGVYRSADAGSTWTKLSGATRGRHINTIAVHPQDGNILYVGLQHGAAYRSIDGGRQWVPMKKGLGNLTVLSLAADPRNPSILWAGTTDGIWRYVLESPTPLTPTPTATEVSLAPGPTSTVTLRPRATSSPTGTPTPTVTLTPTATPTSSPTSTRTPRPSPSHTLTTTPTLTATAVPPPPSLVPPSPTETTVPR